jgi:hypothetical protein
MNEKTESRQGSAKRPAGRTETRISFAIALATLLLVTVYFVQSFIHIQDQEVLVIAIDRLQESLIEAED